MKVVHDATIMRRCDNPCDDDPGSGASVKKAHAFNCKHVHQHLLRVTLIVDTLLLRRPLLVLPRVYQLMDI